MCPPIAGFAIAHSEKPVTIAIATRTPSVMSARRSQMWPCRASWESWLGREKRDRGPGEVLVIACEDLDRRGHSATLCGPHTSRIPRTRRVWLDRCDTARRVGPRDHARRPSRATRRTRPHLRGYRGLRANDLARGSSNRLGDLTPGRPDQGRGRGVASKLGCGWRGGERGEAPRARWFLASFGATLPVQSI
jgi:hypothetical protein